MTNLKLLVFTGILAIALSALCSVPCFGDGTCIETSKCSRAGGKFPKDTAVVKTQFNAVPQLNEAVMVFVERKVHPTVQWFLDYALEMPALSAIKTSHAKETENVYGLDAMVTVYPGNAQDQMDLNAVFLREVIPQTHQTPHHNQQEEKKVAKLPLLQRARLESGLIPGVVVTIKEQLLESSKVLAHTVMTDM